MSSAWSKLWPHLTYSIQNVKSIIRVELRRDLLTRTRGICCQELFVRNFVYTYLLAGTLKNLGGNLTAASQILSSHASDGRKLNLVMTLAVLERLGEDDLTAHQLVQALLGILGPDAHPLVIELVIASIDAIE